MNISNKIKNSTALRLSGSTASKGFTLVELLVVIGIIAILFAVVLVAINPAKRFAESSNARRLADVNSILGAVTTSTVDLKGTLPSGLTMGSGSSINIQSIKPRLIGTDTTASNNIACYNVSTCSVTGFLCSTATALADCPTTATVNTNVCNTTNSRCVLSGRYCAADSDCLSSTSTVLNDCVTGATRVLTASGQTGTCLIGQNTCTGNGAGGSSADCPLMTTNICNDGGANPFKIGHRSAYNLGNSTEGIVPSFLGAMPKDPTGTGYSSANGYAGTFSDTQTGYAIYNVPSFSSVSRAAVTGQTMSASGAGTTMTASATVPALAVGDFLIPTTTTAQAKLVTAVLSSTTYTVSPAFVAAFTAETFTVVNATTGSASGRTKVVACNPNDSDNDGYTNNKIEVLR